MFNVRVLVGPAIALVCFLPSVVDAQSAVLGSCTPDQIYAAAAPNAHPFIDRALDWVNRGVPYCQCVGGQGGPYRTDCSGLVSMAWNLPADSPWGGNTTYHFAGGPWDNGRSTRLSSYDDLTVGDATNYPGDPDAGTGHIRLFAGWMDAGHSSYCSIEEYNTGHPAEIRVHTLDRSSFLPIRLAGWAPNFSCDRTNGHFTFSCDGPVDGQSCVSVNEPADPDTWSDNFLCTPGDEGVVFSASGPVNGMRCAQLSEPSDAHAADWADDYVCVPEQAPYELAWYGAGPIDGWSCVQWNEPVDPDTWNDNYLCERGVSCFHAAGFTFCGAGPNAGDACVQITEPSDPDTWTDNYFCASDAVGGASIGLVWSDAGPIDGMTCTNVYEPSDPQASAWADNYLCVPPNSEWQLSWSGAGPIAGLDCVRWYEVADLAGTWNDNYLCVSHVARTPDVGPTAADGGHAVGLTGGCSVRPGEGSAFATLLAALALVLMRGRRRLRATRLPSE